ncbi:MAG TPA: hypothetical protein VNV85_10850, partial [Puia sp.]|nr:hypothetical protein [Puia sp.]
NTGCYMDGLHFSIREQVAGSIFLINRIDGSMSVIEKSAPGAEQTDSDRIRGLAIISLLNRSS